MALTDDISADLYTHLLNKCTPLSMLNNWKHTQWEMDIAMILKDKSLNEYEIKISRSDFAKDAKLKGDKHRFYSSVRSSRANQLKYIGAVPQKFYYVCPADMIKTNEVPEWAGLIYYYPCADNKFLSIKQVRRLHTQPIQDNAIIKMQTSMCFRLGKNLRDIAKLKKDLNEMKLNFSKD